MNKIAVNRGAKELDKKETYEASGISRITLDRPWVRENDKGIVSAYNLQPLLKMEQVGTNTFRVIA